MRWLAPTPIFFELGGELAADSPSRARIEQERRRQAALFAHLGGDIGDSYAWRVGLSHLRASARNRSYNDVDTLGNAVANSFNGHARLWIVDGVLKWAPNGNATHTNVKLQGEYFRVRDRTERSPTTIPRRPCRSSARLSPIISGPRNRDGMRKARISSCRAGASAIATTRCATAR